MRAKRSSKSERKQKAVQNWSENEIKYDLGHHMKASTHIKVYRVIRDAIERLSKLVCLMSVRRDRVLILS